MSAKMFNIAIPAQAYGHPDALFSWINSHINPGIPATKTKLDIASFESIFNRFVMRMKRMLADDQINAYRQFNNKPLITDDEYATWKAAQSVELNIQYVSDGVFETTFQLCGPAHTAQDDELGYGYIDLFKYAMALYYDPDTDLYHVVCKDTQMGETLPVPPERSQPIKLFPVFSLSYEIDRKQPASALSTQELVDKFRNDFSQAMWENTIEIINHENNLQDMEHNFFGYETIANAIGVLEQQMLTADAFAGNFFKPLMLSAFCIEVPVQEGTLHYTRVTFSYGQRVTIMLPALLLTCNPETNEYTYA